jgi:hypothetical protein
MKVFKEALANPDCGLIYQSSAASFEKIPGSPIAYWVSDEMLNCFVRMPSLGETYTVRQGLATTDNNRFVRVWSEVPRSGINVSCERQAETQDGFYKWFPYNKGGDFRRWWGNQTFVVNWKHDGQDIKEEIVRKYSYLNGNPNFVAKNQNYYFKPSVSFSKVGSGIPAFRYFPKGFVFDVAGSSMFSQTRSEELQLIAFCNTKVVREMLLALSPTLNIEIQQINSLPVLTKHSWEEVEVAASNILDISRADWDNYEISWNFLTPPMLRTDHLSGALEVTYDRVRAYWLGTTDKMQRIEEENNRIFIEAYDLQNELTPDVPLSEITLTCNPHYRYGGGLTDNEREARLKSDTMRELVSYAVGCMMGRYSLAEPGLIYAQTGGVGFDPSRYGEFPADDDGIIPLTEEQWFADEAAVRVEEFLAVVWPEPPIMETLTTLMDGIAMDNADEPRAALRSYLSKQFYKDHLQTYKNRPIYWLFSSGKQKAFEALVYLHRYNEGTLARMRTVYVTPLMGKLQQRMADLQAEAVASSSSAETTRKNREKDKLAKQVVELRAFDEELRHLADQRIPLDLDDGVKVNYARFGNLLAAKDKVCPKKKGEDE